MPRGPADARRRIPQVDRLTREVAGDFPDLPRPVAVRGVRAVVESARRRARRTGTVPEEAELVAMVRDELRRTRRRLLGPVVNATGVIVHTNLGRVPLCERAIEAVAEVARGYSNLEWDAEHGRRGDRYVHVEPLLAALTGAEAALVVNNNAAAVLLVCAALGSGREVVVSRGELIEIGGEFRIPDVLEASGTTLREVGTTNRTHLRDYERAVGDATAFLLKVHPSNYRVVGFTAAPPVSELAKLAASRRIPLVYDVGSGLVSRTMADEPTVEAALAEGADVVCLSGDKLLGGPQSGIVLGRRDLVDRMRQHPLVRPLRPDKMQLAALGATVLSYLEGEQDELPLWRMASASPEALRRRSRRLVRTLCDRGYEADVVDGESVTGGGSLPGHTLPGPVVSVRSAELTAAELASALRSGEPPVAARVEEGKLFVDLRTVEPRDDRLVAGAFPDA